MSIINDWEIIQLPTGRACIRGTISGDERAKDGTGITTSPIRSIDGDTAHLNKLIVRTRNNVYELPFIPYTDKNTGGNLNG